MNSKSTTLKVPCAVRSGSKRLKRPNKTPTKKQNKTKNKRDEAKQTKTYGIGSESPRTTMFNMYYNGIKRMLRDGCAGFPNLSHALCLSCDK